MRHRIKSTAAIAAICLLTAALPATAEELIAKFSGRGNQLTDEFIVNGPWLMDWNVAGDYETDGAIEVSLVDGMLLSHKALILKTRQVGNGTKLFRETGRFRLRIHSTLSNWRFHIYRLTEEEADAMIPAR